MDPVTKSLIQAYHEVQENMTKGYVVTAADKKGNTPAWQGYKAGKKKKDGSPLYRAADHLKDEVENEEPLVDESVGTAIDKTLGAAGEIADTAIKLPAKAIGYVKGLKKGLKKAAKKGEDKAKGDASPTNESYEPDVEIIEKLVESGMFTDVEIAKLTNIQEADIADILAQLEKKRIRQGGDPDKSPLGKKTGRAMKAQQDKQRKKAGM